MGPYRIVSVLGEGGMGTVYAAEQLEPVRRRVAVKLVKLGMDTRDVIARFEAERQALALMNHPSIAQVFDAGVSAAGFGLAYMRRQTADTLLTLEDFTAAAEEARVATGIGERMMAKNPADVVSERGLMTARLSLLSALAGTVKAPTTTPEQREAARAEAGS